MVPLIQDEIVDKRKWIDKEDFIDLLALTQSVPGIFAVNIAIFIGYKLRNFRGALAMALGTILPSFFIMLAIALFFQQFKQYQIVENIFKGIRPAVVALIAAPTFSMAIGQDKPLHYLDTNSIRITYLGIGRIPCLHYHNSGRGGFYIWQVQT